MAEQDDLWAVVVHEDGSKSIVMNDGDLATIATNLQADTRLTVWLERTYGEGKAA